MRHKHKRPNKSVAMKLELVTKKGSINRRIIAKGMSEGREYTLHATKGYRSHKEA